MRALPGLLLLSQQTTHFMTNNFFFENRAFYEIMWKNTVEQDRPQMTVWRKSIACWITRAINKLIICNTCCLSTGKKMFAVARLTVRYTYINCMSCWRIEQHKQRKPSDIPGG